MFGRILIVSVFLFSSCSDDPVAPICGSGKLFEDGDEQVCLFTNPVAGLTCPAAFPEQVPFSDGAIVCSPTSEVPGGLVRKLQTQGYVPRDEPLKNNGNRNNAKNNTNNGTTNNGATNNGMATPIPIQFRLKHTVDTPETFYYQKRDRQNAVGWVEVRREGKRLLISPPCGVPECGKDNALSCLPPETSLFLDQQLSNEIVYDWDGFSYQEQEGCVTKVVPDKTGIWEAQFCIAPSVVEMDGGGTVLNGEVKCVIEAFVPGMRREIISDFE